MSDARMVWSTSRANGRTVAFNGRPATMTSLADAISAGRTTYDSDESLIGDIVGLGKHVEAHPQPKTVSFYWPVTPADGTVEGDKAAATKAEVEARALTAALAAAGDSTYLFWRHRPTWTSERDHEAGVNVHRLHMRCVFAWIPEDKA